MSKFPDIPFEIYRVYPLNTFWSSRAAQDQSSSVVFTDPVALKYRAIKCLNGDTASNLCRKVLFRWYKMGLPSLFRSAFYRETKCNLKENSINIPPSCSSQFVKCCLRLLIARRKTSGPKPSLLRYTTKSKAKSVKDVWFKAYNRRIHPLLVPEIVQAPRYIKNISISCWNLFFRPLSIRQKSQLNIFNKTFLEIISSKNLVQTRRFAPSTQTITSQNKGL
jgi:hypothetical protein